MNPGTGDVFVHVLKKKEALLRGKNSWNRAQSEVVLLVVVPVVVILVVVVVVVVNPQCVSAAHTRSWNSVPSTSTCLSCTQELESSVCTV